MAIRYTDDRAVEAMGPRILHVVLQNAVHYRQEVHRRTKLHQRAMAHRQARVDGADEPLHRHRVESDRRRSPDLVVVVGEHPEEGVDERLVSFVEGVDYFVYDAFFTPEEYDAGKQGWGHSTWLAGVELAKAAGVKSLYLSHFNPNHSDQMIDDILTLAREEFAQTMAAKQGLQLTV